MINRRSIFVILLALLGALANAQSWMASYEKGLRAARSSDWVGARSAFQEAIAFRPEDASGPTTLPGPVADRKLWRDGAPYSPNFLAAYCEYRIGIAAKPEDGRSTLQTAAAEFETLLSKGQASKEAFYFLEEIYSKIGDTAKRLDTENRFKSANPKFRVDNAIVSPEELSVITGANKSKGKPGSGPEVTIIRPGQNPTQIPNGTDPSAGGVPTATGSVPPIATKYALIIGNSTSQSGQGAVPFGTDDAQAVREALVLDAGYPEANVDLVLNATKDQLLASAKALADRMPEEATLFIFFAGNGVNIDGKDFLVAVDSASDTDPSSMTSKMELYQTFLPKAPKIFAFFESPRPMTGGVYFGKEIPMVGSIAQVQATIPGQGVTSEMRNGHPLGIFATAIVAALHDIRSNRVPIMEFGWQVFNRTRGGGSSPSGIGARQVPTLPVLTHMSTEDRF